MLAMPLPLRLGRSGIITRREDKLFPGAEAMRKALLRAAGSGMEVATELSLSTEA